MAIFFGQSSARGVHSVFANKHIYAFDMCFKLIGLSTNVRVIKQNDCGPVTAFPQSHLDFNNINQVLLLKEKTKKNKKHIFAILASARTSHWI